jgi:hypothetical protein
MNDDAWQWLWPPFLPPLQSQYSTDVALYEPGESMPPATGLSLYSAHSAAHPVHHALLPEPPPQWSLWHAVAFWWRAGWAVVQHSDRAIQTYLPGILDLLQTYGGWIFLALQLVCALLALRLLLYVLHTLEELVRVLGVLARALGSTLLPLLHLGAWCVALACTSPGAVRRRKPVVGERMLKQV